MNIKEISEEGTQYIKLLGAFLMALVSRCKHDRITVSAGHLAYVSLLSLVPFVMMFFTILSAFPAFSEVKGQLESFVFTNFVPHAGDVVQEYITQFVGKATEMSAVSILFLAIVALLLISNIDKTLNFIWRTHSERPAIYTFAIYWMVLTLGPLLIGSSVVASSYLVGLANFAEEYTPGIRTMLLGAVPFITSITAFFIIYMVVPNKRINPKYAAIGALIASVLFELSKKGFALYVTNFPSYQVIYGAIAVIPILFVWVYLSWMIVLLGAEFIRELEMFVEEERKKKDLFEEEEDD
ncbi:virulence factor BrkB family protein [Aestuariibacter sp. AA17]|uniref:UPF0761 membrane protein OE749_06290 n=1 Tax=Fluctibacter corallii TaxID=2984329 RepID=A0ABT3A6M8_9ALTE|nr:virulence factor BrkB family protein [Aestuariibacter sp. AA17]MCV2884299.1 virulence factor BrkB family protein [Aestuariibacter sp. AA17]